MRREVDRATAHANLHFAHARGHAGISVNGDADGLAKTGFREQVAPNHVAHKAVEDAIKRKIQSARNEELERGAS